jgi:general secretion pathway protein C
MPLLPSLRDYQNLSPQQWVDRASQAVPRALVVVLTIAIAWQFVQLTWLILDGNDAAAPAAVAASPPAFSAPRKGVDFQAIADAHLFGLARAEPSRDATNAPQTQMNLVLAGTWAAEDPSQGYAFIGESANTARMYAVGKVIRGSTTLHMVHADRVVLDTEGRLETLTLPRLSPGSGSLVTRAAPPASSKPQFTDNLRRLAESNPSAFAEIVRPQPVFANGVQRGYRVYPGRQRQQFSKLGLQPGDLVLSINGTPLDDPQRGMEIFSTMGDSDRVTVTVERNGQSQELTLNTAQIHLPDSGAATPVPGTGKPAPAPSQASPPSSD